MADTRSSSVVSGSTDAIGNPSTETTTDAIISGQLTRINLSLSVISFDLFVSIVDNPRFLNIVSQFIIGNLSV
jgi:hypothetical protein